MARVRPGRISGLWLVVVGVLALSCAAASAAVDWQVRAASTWGVSTVSSVTRLCGGLTPPKPGGGTYSCTFSDDFTGSSLDLTKWSPVLTTATGFGAPGACFTDSKSNLSVSSGTLKLTVRKLAAPVDCSNNLTGAFSTRITGGGISTVGKFSQTYGRFAIRAKFPATTLANLQSSLWMWPTDMYRYGSPWPKSGELDIAEWYSSYPNRAIPYLHYVYDQSTVSAATNTNVVTNNYCTFTNTADFHEYAMEWTPTTLRIIYDGRTCLTDNYLAASPLTGSQPFDQPFYEILTQGVNPAFDPSSALTSATTTVDYVYAWS